MIWERNIDNYKFIEKFSFLAAARIVLEVLQAVFLISLARKSVLAYGNLMLALGIGVILSLIADFGLNQLLVLRLNVRDNAEGRILTNITAVKSVFFVVGWLGAAGFACWQGYDPILKTAVLVMGVGFGMQSLANSFFVALQVNGRQDMEAGIRAIAAILGFGFGIGAVFFNASLRAVACFKVIEGFACCILAVGAVLKLAPIRVAPLRLKELLKTVQGGVVFALITVAQILNDKINLLFLKQYGGSREVAQYSAAWQLVEGAALLMVGLLLRSILFPVFARLWKKDSAEAVRVAQNTLLWLLLVSLPIMFVLYVESDRIIQLVYGSEYKEAIWIQKCLAGTVILNFLQFMGAYMMFSMGKARLLLVFYTSVLAVNFMWCALALPRAPITGALGAMIVSKALIAAMVLTYCQIKIRVIPVRACVRLFLAGAAGIWAFIFFGCFASREIAEAAALLPVFGLAWIWKKNGFPGWLQKTGI
ncbi:MAG: oligosaccharide flippase family protein [Deltaproteobacteria bacterium]|nr:oligosaccharide flippase family protein [Deltaproteobacteria bacterium]